MFITGQNTRSFLDKYSNSNDLDIDLNQLVLRYKTNNDNADFALICNKVLGVITSQAQKLNNPPRNGIPIELPRMMLYQKIKKLKYLF